MSGCMGFGDRWEVKEPIDPEDTHPGRPDGPTPKVVAKEFDDVLMKGIGILPVQGAEAERPVHFPFEFHRARCSNEPAQ